MSSTPWTNLASALFVIKKRTCCQIIINDVFVYASNTLSSFRCLNSISLWQQGHFLFIKNIFFLLCIQYAVVVAKLHETNAENQRLRELIDRLRIDHNALEEHIMQLKQKQNKHEVVLFFLLN